MNQRKRENDRRNVFMTKSPRKNVLDMGIEPGATCMPSEHASDRATAPGLFASKDSKLGHTDKVKMQIDIAKNVPIKMKPKRTSIKNREVIVKTINEMLDADVIKRSRSSWSFPVIIVDKKDGSKRLCVDFRQLNQITKKNSYPLSLIAEIFALLGKANS